MLRGHEAAFAEVHFEPRDERERGIMGWEMCDARKVLPRWGVVRLGAVAAFTLVYTYTAYYYTSVWTYISVVRQRTGGAPLYLTPLTVPPPSTSLASRVD